VVFLPASGALCALRYSVVLLSAIPVLTGPGMVVFRRQAAFLATTAASGG
jgi:hypothetical protein